jgi:methylglutaconyl-CoA hydratase
MTIRLDIQAGIGRLWLARPDKHNAFTGEMLSAIQDAVMRCASDDAVRVIVLCAEGRSFCSGADLAWMAAQAGSGPEGNRANARQLGEVFHTLANSVKPTLARVQGPARGGGVGLAAACDITVASDAASFALTEVRLGLVPGVISPFVVERLGPSHARALFMTGESLPAADAWRLGLVHHLVPAEALDAKVDSVIEALLRGGPEALFACKRLVQAVAFRDKREVFETTVEAIAERRESAEAREGMAAFLEKRPARWVPTPG